MKPRLLHRVRRSSPRGSPRVKRRKRTSHLRRPRRSKACAFLLFIAEGCVRLQVSCWAFTVWACFVKSLLGKVLLCAFMPFRVCSVSAIVWVSVSVFWSVFLCLEFIKGTFDNFLSFNRISLRSGNYQKPDLKDTSPFVMCFLKYSVTSYQEQR